MTVFRGSDAIGEFLKEFDSWLSESVTVYLLGGSAMTVQGLKDQTEDIDLALGVVSEFEHVFQTLTSQGFAVVDEPTESFEGVGTTVELHHDARGLQIDLFERQVVGKVWITDRMHDRAAEFGPRPTRRHSSSPMRICSCSKRCPVVTWRVGGDVISRICGRTPSGDWTTR